MQASHMAMTQRKSGACGVRRRARRRLTGGARLSIAFLLAAGIARADAPWQPCAPADPAADVTSVIELQPHRQVQRLANARGDEVLLINLNPAVGAWYVLAVNIEKQKNALHLEAPAIQAEGHKRPTLSLYRDGLVLVLPGAPPQYFPLWGTPTETSREASGLNPAPLLSDLLKPTHDFDLPFTPICDGLVLVRAQKPGSATRMDRVVDLLRTTRFGDWIVETAKPYLIPAPELGKDMAASGASGDTQPGAGYPRNARVDPAQASSACTPEFLAIATEAAEGKMAYGQWYKAVHHPGVFVSVMKTSATEKAILESYPDRVEGLGKHDNKDREADALVYLVAFDTAGFRFGYALGADHPRVDWSAHAPADLEKKASGPDGFDTVSPLCRIGSIPPYEAPLAAGVFAGGFKREHGAFKFGPLSKVSHATHFGFMEQGTVFSRLQPKLATVWIGLDGAIDLLTWPENVSELFLKTWCVRQNGVPLIEGMDATGLPIPGVYVNQWGPGAWSGSQNGDFLTVRSAIALQQMGARRFVFYAYFTGATSNAMARVFQAYGCRYAMQLDLNSPGHCYMALYLRDASGHVTGAEYLHKEMKDANGSGGALCFLQTNDARDFFYMLRKPV